MAVAMQPHSVVVAAHRGPEVPMSRVAAAAGVRPPPELVLPSACCACSDTALAVWQSGVFGEGFQNPEPKLTGNERNEHGGSIWRRRRRPTMPVEPMQMRFVAGGGVVKKRNGKKLKKRT